VRRTDKEITDRATLDAILHEAKVLRVAMVDGDDRPYLIPISFGYDGQTLFMHSALEGTKLDILRQRPEVCFEVDARVEVAPAEQACGYSMKYFSVVGFGTVQFMTDWAEKLYALNQIMLKYSGRDDWSIGDAALSSVVVWKISITSMTGKKSRYENFETAPSAEARTESGP
jgi:uncharacterized protein